MTKQELIEQTNEIARAMCGYYNDGKCMLKSNGPCEKFTTQQCSYKEDAEMLVYAGYRKVLLDKQENNELAEKIKQAKIDVLNEVKKRIYDISPYNPLVTKDNVKRFIDKLIEEVENGTNS